MLLAVLYGFKAGRVLMGHINIVFEDWLVRRLFNLIWIKYKKTSNCCVELEVSICIYEIL
jgi:hypothetical protein